MYNRLLLANDIVTFIGRNCPNTFNMSYMKQ